VVLVLPTHQHNFFLDDLEWVYGQYHIRCFTFIPLLYSLFFVVSSFPPRSVFAHPPFLSVDSPFIVELFTPLTRRLPRNNPRYCWSCKALPLSLQTQLFRFLICFSNFYSNRFSVSSPSPLLYFSSCCIGRGKTRGLFNAEGCALPFVLQRALRHFGLPMFFGPLQPQCFSVSRIHLLSNLILPLGPVLFSRPIAQSAHSQARLLFGRLAGYTAFLSLSASHSGEFSFFPPALRPLDFFLSCFSLSSRRFFSGRTSLFLFLPFFLFFFPWNTCSRTRSALVHFPVLPRSMPLRSLFRFSLFDLVACCSPKGLLFRLFAARFQVNAGLPTHKESASRLPWLNPFFFFFLPAAGYPCLFPFPLPLRYRFCPLAAVPPRDADARTLAACAPLPRFLLFPPEPNPPVFLRSALSDSLVLSLLFPAPVIPFQFFLLKSNPFPPIFCGKKT